MNGSKIVILPLLLWTVIACTGKTADTAGAETNPAARSVAPVVSYAAGDVSVNDAKAVAGSRVADRSRIVTGADGVCEILFGENIIKVLGDTAFVLDFSNADDTINLEHGSLINVYAKLSAVTGAAGLTVRTRTAACGVRGTTFFIKADADSTYICICNGTLAVQDEKGNAAEEIQASHHLARLFTRSARGTVVTAAPMAYHTDRDMESAAAKIGYTIDWTKIE